MNPVASHGLRALRLQTRVSKNFIDGAITQSVAQRAITQWTCSECRASIARSRWLPSATPSVQRPFSAIQRGRDGDRKPSSTQSPSPQPEEIQDLPSTTARRRSSLTTRLTTLTDTLLARASRAGQHINVYTGTDYSPIEALRSKILSCEADVRNKHRLVSVARQTHQAAHTAQAAAQKEIVSLLERKSTWTPSDLERYMSLVRSEHSNDAAVQAAKEGLAAAERELEDARAMLERLERKQYHEEQVWSDTIRRNSTWVTFGLMGVNLLLLVAQIAVFEPWRRRRIVREVERVVEGKVGRVGEVVEPARKLEVEAVPPVVEVEQVEALSDLKEAVDEAKPAADESLLPEAVAPPILPTVTPPSPPARPDTWSGSWQTLTDNFQDLFSERIIQLKKVDVTTVALQGAATGVAAMGLLFVFFRPR